MYQAKIPGVSKSRYSSGNESIYPFFNFCGTSPIFGGVFSSFSPLKILVHNHWFHELQPLFGGYLVFVLHCTEVRMSTSRRGRSVGGIAMPPRSDEPARDTVRIHSRFWMDVPGSFLESQQIRSSRREIPEPGSTSIREQDPTH